MKKISILTVMVTFIVLGITTINSVVKAQKTENIQSNTSDINKIYNVRIALETLLKTPEITTESCLSSYSAIVMHYFQLKHYS